MLTNILDSLSSIRHLFWSSTKCIKYFCKIIILILLKLTFLWDFPTNLSILYKYSFFMSFTSVFFQRHNKLCMGTRRREMGKWKDLGVVYGQGILGHKWAPSRRELFFQNIFFHNNNSQLKTRKIWFCHLYSGTRAVARKGPKRKQKCQCHRFSDKWILKFNRKDAL